MAYFLKFTKPPPPPPPPKEKQKKQISTTYRYPMCKYGKKIYGFCFCFCFFPWDVAIIRHKKGPLKKKRKKKRSYEDAKI
jgi:hypothetical protein